MADQMCVFEQIIQHSVSEWGQWSDRSKSARSPGGGGGYFLGGYVPPGTPNWHPVLKKNSPKIDIPF